LVCTVLQGDKVVMGAKIGLYSVTGRQGGHGCQDRSVQCYRETRWSWVPRLVYTVLQGNKVVMGAKIGLYGVTGRQGGHGCQDVHMQTQIYSVLSELFLVMFE